MDICLECFSVVNENSVKDKMRTILDKIIAADKDCIQTLIKIINSSLDIIEGKERYAVLDKYAKLSGLENEPSEDDECIYSKKIWNPLKNIQVDTNLSIDEISTISSISKQDVNTDTFKIIETYNHNWERYHERINSYVDKLIKSGTCEELKYDDYEWITTFASHINPKITAKRSLADIMWDMMNEFNTKMGRSHDTTKYFKDRVKYFQKEEDMFSKKMSNNELNITNETFNIIKDWIKSEIICRQSNIYTIQSHRAAFKIAKQKLPELISAKKKGQ